MNSLKKYLMMILLSACMMAFPSHAQENPDLKGTSCVPVKSIREDALAFDHAEIILEGLLRIRNKVIYSDIAFNLLPEESCSGA